MSLSNPAHQNIQTRLTAAFVATIVLCILGFFVSFQSTTVFVKTRTDSTFRSACNINAKMNCELVEKSRWAVVPFAPGLGVEASTAEVVGHMPTALFAMVGYSFIALLSILGLALRKQRRERGVLFLLASVCLLFSFLLLYVMHFMIGSWCTLCLTADLVNVGIFVMAIMALRDEGVPLPKSIFGAVKDDLLWIFKSPLILLAHAVAGFGLLGAAYAGTMTFITPALQKEVQIDQEDEKALAQTADAPAWASDAVPAAVCGPDCKCDDKPAEGTIAPSNSITMGRSADGHYWIGAEKPTMEIEEFTDYQCPHCRKAHMRLRRLLSKHPGELRIYHRHFPLDQACNSMIKTPFHEKACQLSTAAFCAGKQGRFWEMNDLLFQKSAEIEAGKLDPMGLAGLLELDLDGFQCCLDGAEALEALKKDVARGIELGVVGTPAFVVNGNLYLGTIPEEVLAPVKGKDPAAR